MSGNGMRCLAQAAVLSALVLPADLHRRHRGRRQDGRLPRGRHGPTPAEATVGHGAGRARREPAAAVPRPAGPDRRHGQPPPGDVRSRPGRRRRGRASGPSSRPSTRGRINVEFIASGDGTGPASTCGCSSGAWARPRPAAPAVRPPPRPPHSWGLVGDRGGRPQPGRHAPRVARPTTRSCWRGPVHRVALRRGRPGRRAGRRPGPDVARTDWRVTSGGPDGRERRRVSPDRVGLHRHPHLPGVPGAHRAGGRDASPAARRRPPKPASTSWRCSSTRPAPTSPDRIVQRRTAPDPATYLGRGKAEELLDAVPGGRRRHRRLRRRPLARPAAQPGEDPRPDGHRPHRGDPRHLRPERPHPRGPGPGGAGPAPLPAAPAAGPGPRAQPAGRRDRHPGPGRDPARGRPPAAAAADDPAGGRPASARPHPPGPAPGPPARSPAHRVAGRVHQRRQVDAAEPAVRRRRPRREPALLHARPADPPVRPARAARRCSLTDTVGFVRKLPHQVVEAFRSTLEVVLRDRPHRPRGRRVGPRPRGPDRRRAHRAGRDRCRRRCPSCWWSTRPTPSGTGDDADGRGGPAAAGGPSRARCWSRRGPGRGSTSCW